MRLVTFNLYGTGAGANDLVAVNPERIRAITRDSEQSTKIWHSRTDFWIVYGKFEDVKIVLQSLTLRETRDSTTEEKLATAFRKGQP